MQIRFGNRGAIVSGCVQVSTGTPHACKDHNDNPGKSGSKRKARAAGRKHPSQQIMSPCPGNPGICDREPEIIEAIDRGIAEERAGRRWLWHEGGSPGGAGSSRRDFRKGAGNKADSAELKSTPLKLKVF